MNGAATVSVRTSKTPSTIRMIRGGRSHHFLVVMRKCQKSATNQGFFASRNISSLSVGGFGVISGGSIGASSQDEGVRVGDVHQGLGDRSPRAARLRLGVGPHRRGGRGPGDALGGLPLVLTEIETDILGGDAIHPVR